MSCVMCQVSGVKYHIFFNKVVELFGGGSVIKGAYYALFQGESFRETLLAKWTLFDNSGVIHRSDGENSQEQTM